MLTPIPLLAALPFLLPFLSGTLAQDADSTTTPGVTETSSSSVPSSTAEASTIDIDVGSSDGALIFSPETLTASVGDTLNFHFYPRNHSVVQSSFNAPCIPLTSASTGNSEVIYSGFFPVEEGEAEQMFSVVVNTTDAIWLYCSQGTHCQAGMAMVVNPAVSGENTLETYKEAARGVQTAESPTTGVAGGVVVANTEEGEDEEDSGSSNTTTSASTTGSSTTSATAASASASATGAAAGLLSPVTGAVALGMLTLGFGAWTML